MKIGYIHPRSKRTHNLALLRGEFVAPIQYIENMKEGFSLAYKYALRKKNEFAKKCKNLNICRVDIYFKIHRDIACWCQLRIIQAYC